MFWFEHTVDFRHYAVGVAPPPRAVLSAIALINTLQEQEPPCPQASDKASMTSAAVTELLKQRDNGNRLRDFIPR